MLRSVVAILTIGSAPSSGDRVRRRPIRLAFAALISAELRSRPERTAPGWNATAVMVSGVRRLISEAWTTLASLEALYERARAPVRCSTPGRACGVRAAAGDVRDRCPRPRHLLAGRRLREAPDDVRTRRSPPPSRHCRRSRRCRRYDAATEGPSRAGHCVSSQ
ncbi:hypothetical protein GCM10017744_100590 [Streptomyces antimycoticus]|uniref:Uncharacterized protein n=1 Tax=Streptomyces antimycoticus TaxID=68175 RepID=A0A4D4K2B4_9ACTN|nr:hypothetical protein SANT12839_012990 [Streptomyces antimycoticus]